MRHATAYRNNVDKFRLKDREQRKARKAKHKGDIYYHVRHRIHEWKRKTPGSDLTPEYLASLFHNQNGRCYYTDEVLKVNEGTRWELASLDRLNSSDGYRQGNVVWCTNLVNTMKHHLSEEEFYKKMRHILSHRGRIVK